MKSNKAWYAIDNLVYQRSRGYRLNTEDIDCLIKDEAAGIDDNAYLYYLKSCACLEADENQRALKFNIKALQQCRDEIGTFDLIHGQFGSLAEAMKILARYNPTNLEIGWLYEGLSDFNCLDFDNHIFALKHYQATGNTQKEMKLARILTSLYPNHPLLVRGGELKNILNKEVINEKNQASQKDSTVPRLKNS